jgi:DNA-directed RNA polymerase beta subunit
LLQITQITQIPENNVTKIDLPDCERQCSKTLKIMNLELEQPVQYVKVKRPKSVKKPDTQKEIMKIIVEEKYAENLKMHIESAPVDVNDSPLSHLGDYTEEPFTIIESYFRGQHLERLVRHQIESYNHFINFQILRTIQMFNPVNIRSENDFVPENGQYFLETFVSFENFRLYPPQIHENNGATKLMLPQEARLRNFTYSSNMTVDLNIQYVIRNTDKMDSPKIINKTLPKINIGKMPIMTKSSICVLTQNSHISHEFTGECPMDCGGCFIIKGSEKTVLGQERAAENKIYCFDGKNTTKWSWFAEIKSVPDFKCISPKQVEMMIASKNNGFGNGIYITIPRIKQPIELFTLFRAMGIMTDKDICKYIVLDLDNVKCKEVLKFLQASIIDANKYMSQEDALRHITASVAYTPMNMDKETGAIKKREFAVDALNNDLFPHCKTMEQKLYLVGYMANKLIQTSFGWKPPDDRDSYINKRVELTGTLLNNLFRNYFNKLVKEMQKHVVREINNGSWRSTEDYENIINMTNIYKIMKSTTIENGITRALSTGDFSIKQTNSSKVGVAQVLNRLTYASCLSHLRRINTPLEKSGELIAPRKLHGTTWGFLCPAETPEGQSIGCVKSISCLGHITIPTNSSSLYTYVEEYVIKLGDMKPCDLYDKVKVFINGAWVGIAKDPAELYNEMKSKKHKGIINIYTSIIFDYRNAEIRVCSDGGRVSRPVLRVKDGKALITKDIIDRLARKELSWNDLLTSCKLPEAVIEYIDPDEQNWSMIAMKDKDTKDMSTSINYTHCEIHPSTIFGVLSSCTPFPDNNQAPRNTYQCLHVDETVLMSDGRRIRIADVKIGDEVVSFHPETFKTSNTKVINQYVRSTDKQIFKITTEDGRSIIATEDHKFMTTRGWLQVKYMNETYTKIGIYTPENAESHVTFVPVKSITEVDNCMISDITVESDNHSFIAGNNFMSSNCAMAKQALGVYALNFNQRMDKTAYVLTNPSRPLVDTRLMNFIHLNQIPSGCQIHVAIMAHTGYNMEDSVLVNKGSIDRGLFSATIYHTEKDEDKNIIRDEIIRCKPDPSKTRGIKFGNYDKLNAQGFMPENTLIEDRDIIIAKIIPIKEARNDPTKLIKYEDQSHAYSTSEDTYVDKNYTGRNGDGYNFAKVRTRVHRKPRFGDKFSSRHGQKGTCGNIIPEEDMPFTKEGLKPDIIINPHAIPSRMTIGQLKETLLGKVLLELGMFGDGTSFGNLDVKTIAEELQKLGYESYGNEVMYNGLTGEQLETSIFIGPVFYQRLKHMTNDKVHSRATGPMVSLTHQPAEGRSRAGGLRIGEMERDVLISHGATRFCKERLFDVSDKYQVNVCRKCGMIAACNDGNNNTKFYTQSDFTVHSCKTCGNKTDFALVDMPYANKLLFQELQTINVVPRILTE